MVAARIISDIATRSKTRSWIWDQIEIDRSFAIWNLPINELMDGCHLILRAFDSRSAVPTACWSSALIRESPPNALLLLFRRECA
jgi:hypothetical protein